ncbi:hypothetical protein J6590_060437 [Homalodisca vitripennis]|nr:hypothetical protein J6590_060437 [Homalodisca vitripennis]
MLQWFPDSSGHRPWTTKTTRNHCVPIRVVLRVTSVHCTERAAHRLASQRLISCAELASPPPRPPPPTTPVTPGSGTGTGAIIREDHPYPEPYALRRRAARSRPTPPDPARPLLTPLPSSRSRYHPHPHFFGRFTPVFSKF